MQTTTIRPDLVTEAFTCSFATQDIPFYSGFRAIERAVSEHKCGSEAAVSSPDGWLFVNGRFAGQSEFERGEIVSAWEVLEIDYSSRSGFVLRGFNRFTGETFSWDGGAVDERYGFKFARLVNPAALPHMRKWGFEVA